MEEVIQAEITSDEGSALEHFYQPLSLSAKLKSFPEDFIVEENIFVDFTGDGEHCWIYVEKRGCNTDWVAQQLSRYCGVRKSAVSFAGLKDRNAVASQWFSVHLPGLPTPDWHDFESAFNSRFPGREPVGTAAQETIRVLQSHRHNKKLQRGALKSNKFTITMRELSHTNDKTYALLAQRCEEIASHGVPNYFGLQRFGRNYGNLEQANKLFKNPRFRLSRHKRSLYLSAARSWLFNCILSERVKRQVWDKRLPGDVFMLDGRSACFRDEPLIQSINDAGVSEEDDVKARLARNEVHTTAVLWGDGDTMVAADAATLELQVIDRFPVYRDGLVAARLQAQRRACRVVPGQLECRRQEEDFVISFVLPAGSYATIVLAEIFTELVEDA